MKRFHVIITVSLVALSLNAKGQDTLSLEQRINLLEVYNEKILKEEFETQSHKLSSSIQIELEKAKREVTDQLWIIKITGGVIALILAAGVGVALAQYFRGLRKMADEVLKERLKIHLEENSSYILDLITSQKIENQIRKSKKIFVISGSEADLNQTLKLLKDMKFSNVDGKVFRVYENPAEADLIVLSNKDNSLPDELATEFMTKGNGSDNYVFYGARLTFDTKAAYTERLNFANSKYTLFLQIINTLSYKEVINS